VPQEILPYHRGAFCAPQWEENMGRGILLWLLGCSHSDNHPTRSDLALIELIKG
jgi:hypothetical protein